MAAVQRCVTQRCFLPIQQQQVRYGEGRFPRGGSDASPGRGFGEKLQDGPMGILLYAKSRRVAMEASEISRSAGNGKFRIEIPSKIGLWGPFRRDLNRISQFSTDAGDPGGRALHSSWALGVSSKSRARRSRVHSVAGNGTSISAPLREPPMRCSPM